MQKKLEASIVCYGEVLWDIFDRERKPGGAPLNVAYHLRNLGVESYLISRVGNDELGRNLMSRMEEWKMPLAFCQKDQHHPTGTVLAKMDKDYEVNYDIVFPVAWDYIQWENQYKELVGQSTCFVFGSLIMRNETSFKTLKRLLSIAPYRVFDVNLRSPHYDKELILDIMNDVELLKLNEGELEIISSWLGLNKEQEKEKVQQIQKRFDIQEVLLTKGERGASYYKESVYMEQSAPDIQVVDTVGSGDAFLAGFLSVRMGKVDYFEGHPLDAAVALGALVASKRGGCPPYDILDLTDLMKKAGIQN